MNSLGQIVWQALVHASWLPLLEPRTYAALFANLSPGDDILPLIARAWSRADEAGSARRESARRESKHVGGCRPQHWAHTQIARGARLTIGPDVAHYDGFQRWNGVRLVWWPQGVPAGDRVGLVSSHLGRDLNQSRDWFRALRAACAQVARRDEVVVSAKTTTAYVFARHAAELFGLRILLVTPPGKHHDCRAWLKAFVAHPHPPDPHPPHPHPPDPHPPHSHPATGFYEAHVSPALDDGSCGASPEFRQSPLADRLLMTMSDRLLLVYLRARGKLLPLVRRRLADPAWGPQAVYVALGPRLVPRSIADELLADGAVGWVVLPDAHDAWLATTRLEGRQLTSTDCAAINPSGRIIDTVPAGDWSFLTHCTRAPGGAWPGQSANDFLNELILSAEIADRSAFATLTRILDQQRIFATSSAIRGGTAMVSFTAVPLVDLPRFRTFRVHRGRWDFEPYGICIRRERLRQLGARAVLYGDHAAWDGLDHADRPFFQRQFSANTRTGDAIDWSTEREWRVRGDVNLRDVDDASALVFVASLEEARKLLPHSRWPIAVLGATSSSCPR